MKICKHCNLTYTDDIQFCPQCGSALTDEQTLVCANCGQALKNDDLFCPSCGAKVGNNNIPPTPLRQNSTEIPEVNNNQTSQGEASVKGKEPVQGKYPAHREAPTPKKETPYFLFVGMVTILSVVGLFIFFLFNSLTPKEAVDKSLEKDIKQSHTTGARSDNSKNTTPKKPAANRTSSNAKAGKDVYVGTYSDDGSDAYIMTQSIHISSRNPYTFTCTIKATGDLLHYKFYPKNGSPYYENSEGYHAFVFGGQSPVAESIYRYVVNNY